MSEEQSDRRPDFPEVLDSTMLSTFDACPQKFFNEYVIRLAARGTSIHLHAGKAFATICETVRREVFVNGTSLPNALGIAFVEYNRAWNPYPLDESLHTKNFINIFNAAIEYFNEYPPEDDIIQPYVMQNGNPAIEFTFSMELPFKHPTTGNPLLYGGRFDMLGVTPGGSLCVLDEKSASSIGAQWSRKWDMRGQFLGYIMGAQQFFGERCDSFVVRGIAIQKTKFDFASYGPIMVERWRLDDWWRTTIFKVGMMLRMWNTMKEQFGDVAEYNNIEPEDANHAFWPRSYGDACSSYNGCQFLDLCNKRNPSHWYGDYDERVWNPLDKDHTKGSKMVTFETVEPVLVPGFAK